MICISNNKIRYLFFILASSFLLYNCNIKNNSDVIGKYVIVNNNNTIDTLKINKNFTYSRSIYTSDNRFIYKNTGNWKIENNSRIELSTFFIDRDLIYNEDYYVIEEGLMYVSFEIKKYFSSVKIYSNLNLKDSYYIKVDDTR
jgi:hypothetical protein